MYYNCLSVIRAVGFESAKAVFWPAIRPGELTATAIRFILELQNEIPAFAGLKEFLPRHRIGASLILLRVYQLPKSLETFCVNSTMKLGVVMLEQSALKIIGLM